MLPRIAIVPRTRVDHDAVADAKGKRPIPDDATWLTVTVVDAAGRRAWSNPYWRDGF